MATATATFACALAGFSGEWHVRGPRRQAERNVSRIFALRRPRVRHFTEKSLLLALAASQGNPEPVTVTILERRTLMGRREIRRTLAALAERGFIRFNGGIILALPGRDM